ncbi:MAG: hypothetical protein AB9866_19140 [Syntrophobacteraceae bacterium]
MDWIFARPVMIALGMVAALLIIAGTIARAKERERLATYLNTSAYALFLLCIGLFIAAGFISQ